jgi:transcriptional regulator with XRE-family HTH domain
MKLGDYLESQGEKPTQFARRIGVSPSTILRVLSSEREPGIGLAAKIVAGSAGAVSFEDLAAAAPIQAEAAE